MLALVIISIRTGFLTFFNCVILPSSSYFPDGLLSWLQLHTCNIPSSVVESRKTCFLKSSHISRSIYYRENNSSEPLGKWWSIWVTESLNRIHKRTLFSDKIISWVELLSGIIWWATKSFLETHPYLECRGNGLEQVRMRRRTVLYQYNIQQPMRTVKELEWASLDL